MNFKSYNFYIIFHRQDTRLCQTSSAFSRPVFFLIIRSVQDQYQYSPVQYSTVLAHCCTIFLGHLGIQHKHKNQRDHLVGQSTSTVQDLLDFNFGFYVVFQY